MRSIVWFRGKDLRVTDHAPLLDACEKGEVIPLFVLDPCFFSQKRAARLPHRMQFLLESLQELQQSLRARGSDLVLVAGQSVEVVPRLMHAWQADRVVAQHWVEPFARERDRRVHAALGDRFQLFHGETLRPPGSLRTKGGTPFLVFSHFARTFHALAEPPAARSAPKSLPALPPEILAQSQAMPTCETLGIARNPALISGGEKAGHSRLKEFMKHSLHHYGLQRDRMDNAQGTSRLSADLKFGTLSIRHVFHTVSQAVADESSKATFINELLWREFAYSTLWDRPELLTQPFRESFSHFPWSNDARLFEAWKTGATGYPIVDAAARQLLSEGFVHNRARMIAASFLCKHLLVSYRRGETHYMKYLVDGDWASNNMGWQWSAGCGCDAQPYFRVFNPFTQGQKFDPEGSYVKRWVPELAALPARYIHNPAEAPPAELRAASVVLGTSYPRPIVVHQEARQRFLVLASGTQTRSE